MLAEIFSGVNFIIHVVKCGFREFGRIHWWDQLSLDEELMFKLSLVDILRRDYRTIFYYREEIGDQNVQRRSLILNRNNLDARIVEAISLSGLNVELIREKFPDFDLTLRIDYNYCSYIINSGADKVFYETWNDMERGAWTYDRFGLERIIER